jgi:O-glycosyl hydrolase
MKILFLYLGLLLSFFYSRALFGQNLISNGDFEGGCISWWNGAGGGGSAVFTCPVTGAGNVHAGNNALRSNITAIGANPWDVQTIHSGFTASPGLPHSLTFWAKASVAGRQVRIVIQNSTYTAQNYTLTTGWTEYTFNFTPTEASLQLKIHYIQTGDFFFDDFSIIDPSGDPALITSTITPATSYQQMVGFGGALTWYADRIANMTLANRNAICDLMFTDLGLDILRLKNWYYPLNYPANKATTTMDPNYYKASFDFTNQLYTLAKSRNPNIEVLLCSWSPPKALKSNNALPEGTLKQSGGQFMYKEFAQYWVDILDNISFVPDYISIQNEPGYVNPGWETCEWRPVEGGGFPGYDKALDSVYNRIKNRPNVPKILGPEPENLGSAGWNPAVNTFRELATPIKNKSYLHGYAYHLYNYYGGAGSIAPGNLNIVRDEFSNRPNFMTEFSSPNYTWIDAARMIHAALTEANTSAYIYWELAWDGSSNETMIALDNSGGYTIRDFYYSVKHYAKFVDKGYTRVAASGSNATLNVTAFRNPGGNQITIVAINNHAGSQPLNIVFNGASFSSANAYRSVAGNYWQNLGAVSLAATQNLPGKSLTTFVVNITPLPVTILDFKAFSQESSVVLKWKTASEENVKGYHVMRSLNPAEGNWDNVGFISALNRKGTLENYILKDDNTPEAPVLYYKLISEDFDGSISSGDIISISPAIQKMYVKIYPNPSSEVFFIEFPACADETSFRVIDPMGKTVETGLVKKGEKHSFGSSLAAGIYVVEFVNDNNYMSHRIIKK